jgi:L-lactate dehydrogenase complex protein LldE
MLRYHYPALFEGRPEEKKARNFSGRVYELTEFLIHVLKIQPEDRGEPVKITWHSSCHASREMKVTQGCKDVLRKLKHVELVEMDREHECCGFGGTFSVKQPEISAVMVEDKISDILKTGAGLVLSTDCGCLMNMTGAMNKRGLAVKGMHIAEFLWERLYG